MPEEKSTKKSVQRKGVGEREYFDLPYGWKKESVTIKNQPSKKGKDRVDIYLVSPTGKKLQKPKHLESFLKENPNIKCDLEVTSFKKSVHYELMAKSMNVHSQDDKVNENLNSEQVSANDTLQF